MRWFHRLWPRTLFGQLLLIMVSGTLVIQLMSSSIWFDVRFAQALEVPVRLVAARSAPLIAQADCHGGTLQAPATTSFTASKARLRKSMTSAAGTGGSSCCCSRP